MIPANETVTLFLCGDVMTGRSIDQALPHPSDPIIHEPYLRDAREYLRLAEAVNGPIPAPVDFAYIWGDALEELERLSPDARIINLETSITTTSEYWVGKGINYRMHPGNIGCLTAAGIDVCSLANNHVLDWGYSGLTETMETLRAVRTAYSGAGWDQAEAEGPVILPINQISRLVIVAAGTASSGIPPEWAALGDKPGVHYLESLSPQTADRIGKTVRRVKQPGDIAVFSIHWGGNWGYDIPSEHRRFAHALIDRAEIDIIHGHSSHHVLGIEVYRGKPILYGCGDFINDYEGIGDYEAFRGDLSLMYFVTMAPSGGNLTGFRMTPMQMRRFKPNRASKGDAAWLKQTLDREGGTLNTRVEMSGDHRLILRWK